MLAGTLGDVTSLLPDNGSSSHGDEPSSLIDSASVSHEVAHDEDPATVEAGADSPDKSPVSCGATALFFIIAGLLFLAALWFVAVLAFRSVGG